MSDITHDYLAQHQADMERRREKLATMKAVLLDALKANGVATVTITYDGEGDSGQISEISAVNRKRRPVALDKPHPISIAADDEQTAHSYATLSEFIDEYAWEILALYHGGFENNEGGFGTIVIEVASGKITIDHNDRIIEVSNTLTEV